MSCYWRSSEPPKLRYRAEGLLKPRAITRVSIRIAAVSARTRQSSGRTLQVTSKGYERDPRFTAAKKCGAKSGCTRVYRQLIERIREIWWRRRESNSADLPIIECASKFTRQDPPKPLKVGGRGTKQVQWR